MLKSILLGNFEYNQKVDKAFLKNQNKKLITEVLKGWNAKSINLIKQSNLLKLETFQPALREMVYECYNNTSRESLRIEANQKEEDDWAGQIQDEIQLTQSDSDFVHRIKATEKYSAAILEKEHKTLEVLQQQLDQNSVDSLQDDDQDYKWHERASFVDIWGGIYHLSKEKAEQIGYVKNEVLKNMMKAKGERPNNQQPELSIYLEDCLRLY